MDKERLRLQKELPQWRTWAKPAAVTLHLAPAEDGAWQVLLIGRPNGMREHAGQVACPGGRYDPDQDRDLWQTAVRESWEEVGLRPDESQRLGYLDPLYVAASGYTVLPCVVEWPRTPAVTPAPDEVEDLRWVSLAALRAVEGRVWRHGEWVPDYPLPWRRVWGATAKMLHQLLQNGCNG